MKRFIIKIIKYSIVVLILFEIVVRLFTLTNDVPQRDLDENGLQVFQKNQEGKSNGHKWRVNSSGFLGHDEVKGENQVLIIGDSFVENIMNPFECRQSSLFKKNGYDVFEIGRSGITFVESLEFYSKYKSEVNPKISIFIIDNSDFEESIQEINKLNDRVQISLKTSQLSLGKIKAKYIKKFLYNYKTLYYLYLKYLKSQKAIITTQSIKVNHLNNETSILVDKLIRVSNQNYDLNDCLFVFRGGNDYKELFNQLNLSFIELNLKGAQYTYSENDSHWSCKGHQIAFETILEYIGLIKQ
jgi:hypothetical protein